MGRYELGDYESKIITAIYDAALNSTKWRAVLADICQVIDADEASLLFYDAQHQARNFVVTAFNLNNDQFVNQHLDAEVRKIKQLFSSASSGQLFTAHSLRVLLGTEYEEFVGEPSQIAERKKLHVRVAVCSGQVNLATI